MTEQQGSRNEPENSGEQPSTGAEDTTSNEASPNPIPQPAQGPYQSSVDSETRQWAIFIHASAIAGYFVPVPFGTVVLPLLIWLLKRNELPGLDEHGKAALNFQITAALAFIVSLILLVIIIGFFLIPLLAIYVLVEIILNSVRASNGQSPNYHLSINFVK